MRASRLTRKLWAVLPQFPAAPWAILWATRVVGTGAQPISKRAGAPFGLRGHLGVISVISWAKWVIGTSARRTLCRGFAQGFPPARHHGEGLPIFRDGVGRGPPGGQP